MRFEFLAGDHSLSSLSDSFSKRVATSVRASVVAVLTAVDVGGRTLQTLLTRLLDTDFVPVGVSLFLNSLTNSDLLPTASPFLLYGYLVYTLSPRLFPGRLRHVTERRGFRLVTTGYVLLVPFLAFTNGPEWDTYFLLSGLVVLPMYLVVTQRGTFLSRDGYPIAMINAFSQYSDVQDEFEDDPAVRDRTLKFWAGLTVFGFFSVILSWLVFVIVGVLLFFLSLIYPVPELLLFGWVGQRVLLRGPIGPDEEVLARNHLDLETRVLTPASVAVEGIKGFASVLMTGVGLGIGVIFLWISISNVGTFVDLAARTPTFSPARLASVLV